MDELIEKILKDTDKDIREAMLTVCYRGTGQSFKAWELVDSPLQTILLWQLIRQIGGKPFKNKAKK